MYYKLFKPSSARVLNGPYIESVRNLIVFCVADQKVQPFYNYHNV